ncbi:MAG: hypothetical protein PHN88_06295 [Ignavibacteria bacterium]|nr:hypothetical protein [Ignavibacteria bacterium]
MNIGKLASRTLPLFLILTIILLSVICLNSCSDDIVSPPQIGFDSARFYWEHDTTMISGFIEDFDLYTPDTNNIFITSYIENMIFRRTKTAKERYYFPNNERVQLMVGSDLTNSYLFGYTENAISFDTYKPFIMKWNGSGFDKLPSSYILSGDGFNMYAGLYVNPSEMWIACLGGRVLRYNGNDFELSTLKDSTIPDKEILVRHIYADKDNKIKILAAYKEVWETAKYIYIFEYRNGNWEIIFKEEASLNHQSFSVLSNKDIVISGPDGVYLFDGQRFNKAVEPRIMHALPVIAGSSINNFMAIGRTTEPPPCFVYNWNGTRWSKEVIGYIIGHDELKMVNDNYFVYVNNFQSLNDILIGRRKSFTKLN